MRAKPELADLRAFPLHPGVLLWNEVRDTLVYLNPTAASMLELVRQGYAEDDVVARATAEYGQPEQVVREALADLLRQIGSATAPGGDRRPANPPIAHAAAGWPDDAAADAARREATFVPAGGPLLVWDTVLDVQASTEVLREAIAPRFPAMAPARAVSEGRFEILPAVGDAGYLAFFEGALVVRAEGIDQLVYGIYQYATSWARERLEGVVLHGSAVALDDRGVLITGPSGAGKSTLTAALVERGFRYVADEAVALVPGTARARGLARPIKLERAGAALFDGTPSERSQQRLVFPSAQPPADAPVRLVVVSEVDAERPTRSVVLDPGPAFDRVNRQRFVTAGEPANQLSDLCTLVNDSVVIHLRRRALDEACEIVTELVLRRD